MKTYGLKRGFNTGMSGETKRCEVHESIEIKRLAGKRKAKRFLSNKYVNQHVIFEHVLQIGDNLMPVTKNLTLQEAYRENRKYEAEFLANKKPRLYRWRPLDCNNVDACRKGLAEMWVEYGHKGFREIVHKMGYETR